MVWQTGVVPRDWRRAVVVPIHKRGSKKLCKKYRGISLLSVPGKVFASILNHRVCTVTEDKIMEEQAGFKKRQRVYRTDICDETAGREDD